MTVPWAQRPKDERHRCLDYVVLLPDLLRGLRDIASTAHDTQDDTFDNMATNLVTKLAMLMNGMGHWWNGFQQRRPDLFDPDSDAAGYDATNTSSADLPDNITCVGDVSILLYYGIFQIFCYDIARRLLHDCRLHPASAALLDLQSIAMEAYNAASIMIALAGYCTKQEKVVVGVLCLGWPLQLAAKFYQTVQSDGALHGLKLWIEKIDVERQLQAINGTSALP